MNTESTHLTFIPNIQDEEIVAAELNKLQSTLIENGYRVVADYPELEINNRFYIKAITFSTSLALVLNVKTYEGFNESDTQKLIASVVSFCNANYRDTAHKFVAGVSFEITYSF
jgi:hypothetical protein